MTAELAVVLPVVVLVTVALVWLVAVAGAQLRCVDAAREAARALARDEGVGAATALAGEVGPPGSAVSVSTSGADVAVVVRATARGSGLLAGLPGLEVSGRAVARREAAAPP